MKRKIVMTLSLFLVLTISVFIVRALTFSQPTDVVNVTKTSAAGCSDCASHATYTLDVSQTHLESDPYIGIVVLDVDPGYYIKSFTATYDGNPLELGFVGGTEQGEIFRPSGYRADITEYQFIIPDEASTSKKVEVTFEVDKKKPIDITYIKYTSNDTSDDALNDPDNYDFANETPLVSKYMDGDIVLPTECLEKGCALQFKFNSVADYEEYESHIIHNDNNQWFWGDGFIFEEGSQNNVQKRTVLAEKDMCDKDNLSCFAVVKKDFNEIAYTPITIGYTEFGLYSPDFVGVRVSMDINNFSDTLGQDGTKVVGFTNEKNVMNIELFYGTKRIYLTPENGKPVVLGEGGASNMPALKDFDTITGEDFAYETTYDSVNNRYVVNINSYYQDKITLELTFKKNNTNIFNDKVKINLDRFAFSGNGGELLEVDSLGRNCRETTNGNTCDQGRFYSTEYRGMLSAFYVKESELETHMDEDKCVNDETTTNSNTLTLTDGCPDRAYKRNKDFNPHAIALFYDENGEIVLTKDFDLNAEVKMSGFVKNDVFTSVYTTVGTDDSAVTVTKDYMYLGHTKFFMPFIKDIEYFERHLDATIMHEMVLISKDEAQEKGIKKIALFIVNGEVEENNIPALTYGVGEGKVLEIRDGE